HSRKGNCLDNACIESFFSHLKTEKLYMDKCTSMDELHQAIGQYITFYNYTTGGSATPIALHSSRAGPNTPGTRNPACRISTVICPRW
ncbi:IS3 family transposase, partial [Aneurinibacillus thermoaerophilus]|uniref:IS3 family transposase n=1 Tax=Aneurinibacillus thermoaerophilus TaxID=143495 RepID=UPI00399C6D72